MRAIKHLFLLTLVFLAPTIASAQEEAETSVFWDVTKSVVFDPSTYAPAVISYTAMKKDWETSQPLFRNGWLEQNHRFTVTGRPNDKPISFADGNKKIRRMALIHLQGTVLNHAAANVFERVLTERYPQHRKLFKTLSWIERIAFSSYLAHLASANHFKQARLNRELAMQYGYR